MTGAEFFLEIGKIDEEFLLEAGEYSRNTAFDDFIKQLLPLAAGLFLALFTGVK